MRSSAGRASEFRAPVIAAVADQALVGALSLSALVVSARLLEVREYASFAIGYSAYLLVYAMHTALLSEPLLVLASSAEERKRGAVIQAVRAWNNRLAVAGALTLLASGTLSARAWILAIGAAVGAAMCSSLVWEFRRRAYAEGRVWRSPLIAAAHLAAFASMLAIVNLKSQPLRSTDVFVSLGTSGLLVGLLARFAWRESAGARASAREMTDAMSRISRYALGAAGTAAVVWMAANLGYVLLSGRGSSGDVSLLRAFMNIVLPWQQLTVGLGILITVRSARDSSGPPEFAALKYFKLAGLLGAAGVVYGAVVLLLGGTLVSVLYGEHYQNVGTLLWAAPALAGLWGVQAVLASSLRGRNELRFVLIALASGNAVGWLPALFLFDRLSATQVVASIIALHVVAIGGMILPLSRPKSAGVLNGGTTANG